MRQKVSVLNLVVQHGVYHASFLVEGISVLCEAVEVIGVAAE